MGLDPPGPLGLKPHLDQDLDLEVELQLRGALLLEMELLAPLDFMAGRPKLEAVGTVNLLGEVGLETVVLRVLDLSLGGPEVRVPNLDLLLAEADLLLQAGAGLAGNVILMVVVTMGRSNQPAHSATVDRDTIPRLFVSMEARSRRPKRIRRKRVRRMERSPTLLLCLFLRLKKTKSARFS